MKKVLFIIFFSSFFATSFGQNDVKEEDKTAFVLFNNVTKNVIIIPNLGKLHTFKIYRKLKEESDFQLVATKKKPPLPMRDNITPYGVTWEDTLHSRDIEYKIVALNKKGEELCEMKVIWQEKK